MEVTERFKATDGTLYEKQGRYFYKSNGMTDKKGNPVMRRVSEAVYEAAHEAWRSNPIKISADADLKDGTARFAKIQPQEAKETAPMELVEVAKGIGRQDDLTDAEWERLKGLFDSKIELEKHAFQSNDISLSRKNGLIYLSGLHQLDKQSADAAHLYLRQLIKLAKESTRVNHSGSSAPENERYSFRIWLLRLGFIGPDFKQARATLLAPLPGSASFRDRKRKEEE